MVTHMLDVFLPLHAQPGDAIKPLVGWRYLTAWTWSWGVIIPLLASLIIYLLGVRKLHKRGIAWPRMRTFSWVSAHVWLAIALLGFLGTYDNVLFWVHMVQHMILTMIVGVHIAQAAPVTLALRTLPHRLNEIFQKVLHSKVAKLLLFPPLTTLAMVGYPFLLYTTKIYEYTLHNDWAHEVMHVWMVYIGAAFFVPIIGIDPIPNKLPHPLRFLLVLLNMPAHAFMGVTIMASSRLIAEDWYTAFGRSWGISPARDQTWAGGILWATGDLTMLTVLTGLAVSWWRDSQREAKRIDRALDREEAAADRRAQEVGHEVDT